MFFMSPIVIPCLVEYVETYFNKVYSLKEHEAVFLKKQNVTFSAVAGSIWFVFYFRINVRFKISCYGWGGLEFWDIKFQYLIDFWSVMFCVSNQTYLIDVKKSCSLYSENTFMRHA